MTDIKSGGKLAISRNSKVEEKCMDRLVEIKYNYLDDLFDRELELEARMDFEHTEGLLDHPCTCAHTIELLVKLGWRINKTSIAHSYDRVRFGNPFGDPYTPLQRAVTQALPCMVKALIMNGAMIDSSSLFNRMFDIDIEMEFKTYNVPRKDIIKRMERVSDILMEHGANRVVNRSIIDKEESKEIIAQSGAIKNDIKQILFVVEDNCRTPTYLEYQRQVDMMLDQHIIKDFRRIIHDYLKSENTNMEQYTIIYHIEGRTKAINIDFYGLALSGFVTVCVCADVDHKEIDIKCGNRTDEDGFSRDVWDVYNIADYKDDKDNFGLLLTTNDAQEEDKDWIPIIRNACRVKNIDYYKNYTVVFHSKKKHHILYFKHISFIYGLLSACRLCEIGGGDPFHLECGSYGGIPISEDILSHFYFLYKEEDEIWSDSGRGVLKMQIRLTDDK